MYEASNNQFYVIFSGQKLSGSDQKKRKYTYAMSAPAMKHSGLPEISTILEMAGSDWALDSASLNSTNTGWDSVFT